MAMWSTTQRSLIAGVASTARAAATIVSGVDCGPMLRTTMPRRTSPCGLRTTPGQCPRSVELLLDRGEGGAGERVVGRQLERTAELVAGARQMALRPVDLPEVTVRIVTRLVARRLDRRLEPGDRLVEPAEPDQIRADVVVRVAEVGVDRDRLATLGDRILV